MPRKKYLATPTPDERAHLDALLRKGKTSALVLTRARILLKADQAADGGPAWLVELVVVPAVTDETVRRAMGKTRSSRGSRSSVASRPGRRASSSPGWRT